MSDRGPTRPRSKPAPCSDGTRQAHKHVAIVETSNLVALPRRKLGLGHDLYDADRALGIDPETMRTIRKSVRQPDRRR